jgi:hypothetical protein
MSFVQRLLLTLDSARQPLDRLGWPPGRRQAVLRKAREAFTVAVDDLDPAAVAGLLDRVRLARSLHQLWHLRAEVFSRVARASTQAEAKRRLAELDRHFPNRERHARGGRAAPRES